MRSVLYFSFQYSISFIYRQASIFLSALSACAARAACMLVATVAAAAAVSSSCAVPNDIYINAVIKNQQKPKRSLFKTKDFTIGPNLRRQRAAELESLAGSQYAVHIAS